MKDIEKMRKEFERKIKCAEISNEVEKEIGIECSVMENGSCTEEELDVVAHAIGDGNNADFLVVYDKPVQNPYTATPYKVYWDCM